MTALWCLVILGTLVWQGYGNSLEAEANRLEHILDRCTSHSDCSSTQVCFKNQCQFACRLGMCGIDAECRVINHVAQCRCPPGYKGDPHVRCRPAVENESEFKCGLDGIYPNPDNCSSFIQCSNGYKHIMPCPKGLHYDVNTKACQKPCDAYCNKTQSCQCKWSTCGLDDVCFLSKEVGICKAIIPRFFFNKRTGKCEPFHYGGCGGNENNFRTVKECEERCHVQNDENICRLPAEIGPCKGHIPRYFFDHTKGSCERFIYGGCRGNANNFQTLRECETRCLRKTLNSEDTCRLPSKQGPCKGHFPRYFFDHTKGKCEEFIYGGCDGNANNFETVRECEQACLRQSMNSENTCRLPSETGPCDGHFPRYFFDHTKGNCEEFVYGGCGGNSNNFKTREECELRCLMKTDSSSERDSLSSFSFCGLPASVGPCKDFEVRYHYNMLTDKCETFNYSGCEGNRNNFKTKEACEKECGHQSSENESEFKCGLDGIYPNPDNCSSFIQCSNGYKHITPCPMGLHYDVNTKACQMPCDAYCNKTQSCQCKWSTCGLDDVCFLSKEVGICKAIIPRFFFNKRNGKCEPFHYGGCGGNENNFRTVKECEERCHVQNDENICRLPAEIGPCKGHIPRYFFDHTKGSCERFIYGGCRGNANNFQTLRECETRCLRKT
ncbi:papilin, partial [Trichonephila clavata]